MRGEEAITVSAKWMGGQRRQSSRRGIVTTRETAEGFIGRTSETETEIAIGRQKQQKQQEWSGKCRETEREERKRMFAPFSPIMANLLSSVQ